MNKTSNQTENKVKTMNTHRNLTNNSIIRVNGVMGKVTIETLAAYAVKHGQTVQHYEKLAKDGRYVSQDAWTMQHAACLTADYAGKAEAHAAEQAAKANAPLVNTGDVLVIDGVAYTAKVLGNFSDPVRLTRVAA